MEVTSQNRGVLTLAYGQSRFLEQAKDLGLSLLLHAPHLPRALVTDSEDPELRSLFTHVVPLRTEFGSGVRQKLYLDRYSPFDETLFIDSDCLVLGDLETFWTTFTGQSFGVPGFRYLRKGDTDPYMDVEYLLDRLKISSLPKFNGGTYYFTRCAAAIEFFETARRIMSDWGKLRLGSFRRNGPADEAVYSVAMAIHNVNPTYMGSGGMWTPCGYHGKLELNGVEGTCRFEKEGEIRTPEIVHFPGEYIYCFPYVRERARIRRRVLNERTSSIAIANAYAASLVWQLSRRSSWVSALGRSAIRAYRSAANSIATR